jgi:alkylhydroperoxidase family enzyme
MADHSDLVKKLEAAVLDGPGAADAKLRRAAASGGEVPQALRTYVQKVRHTAWQVTDEEVEKIRAAGYTEDQVFEITVATAVGAALHRLKAGLRALGGK